MDHKERARIRVETLRFVQELDAAGVTPAAREDALRHLDAHFGEGQAQDWEIRQVVQELKTAKPYYWQRGAPSSGGQQPGVGQEQPKGKGVQYRDLTSAEVRSLQGLSPTDRLTKARELQSQPAPTT